MRDVDVQSLLAKVRQGEGLKLAIKQSGLHVKNTLTTLRDTRRDEFREAKLEARRK